MHARGNPTWGWNDGAWLTRDRSCGVRALSLSPSLFLSPPPPPPPPLSHLSFPILPSLFLFVLLSLCPAPPPPLLLSLSLSPSLSLHLQLLLSPSPPVARIYISHIYSLRAELASTTCCLKATGIKNCFQKRGKGISHTIQKKQTNVCVRASVCVPLCVFLRACACAYVWACLCGVKRKETL